MPWCLDKRMLTPSRARAHADPPEGHWILVASIGELGVLRAKLIFLNSLTPLILATSQSLTGVVGMS